LNILALIRVVITVKAGKMKLLAKVALGINST